MKGWLITLGLVLSLLGAGGSAAAHSLSLTAALSVREGVVTVRLLDPYGAAVAGGQVSVAALPAGGAPGNPAALREELPGVYTGAVGALAGAGAGERFDLRLKVTLGADLYRLELKGLTAGALAAEQRAPMLAVEPKAFPWGAVLYGAAVVVLGAATTVALVRRRSLGAEG